MFLRDMLFDSDGHLGLSKEGTVDNPIIIHGCTDEMFANFLGWLNHEYVFNSLFKFYLLILSEFVFGQAVHGLHTG